MKHYDYKEETKDVRAKVSATYKGEQLDIKSNAFFTD